MTDLSDHDRGFNAGLDAAIAHHKARGEAARLMPRAHGAPPPIEATMLMLFHGAIAADLENLKKLKPGDVSRERKISGRRDT